jgi:3-deoxy-D-manno-octulosonate 8-phosphate phosphatase (KDO 8-P phosphatase)
MVRVLDPEEIARRARKLRLVVTDVDGVLTDGGVYYGAQGEELKRFSLRDGMGVERLRAEGIETIFLTRETSPIVQASAAKLRVPVYGGVRDKRAHFPSLLADAALEADAVAYLGDDVNDLELLEHVSEQGLSGAPADAAPELTTHVHYITSARGGHGAFREFAEFLLRPRR